MGGGGGTFCSSQILEWKKSPRLILRWSDSVIYSHSVISDRERRVQPTDSDPLGIRLEKPLRPE